MIQDIYPSKLDNAFRNVRPAKGDNVLIFDKDGNLFVRTDDEEITFTGCTQAGDEEAVYLFSIDNKRYFLSLSKDSTEEAGFAPYPIRKIRDIGSGPGVFAAFTAYHLWKWYYNNHYCGSCATLLVPDDKERALRCGKCGRLIYPRINPAVIVGVINNDSLLITRYNRGYAHNALIAGFCEIGETLEQTVEREVMEEAGVKVKNIRYYKSQPWGMAEDLLMGFYCDLDGDGTIHMDEGELKYAQWTRREEIELQPGNLSLTNEMMRMFKESRI